MPTAVESVVVEVSDLESAVRDYARLLGHEPLRVSCRPDGADAAEPVEQIARFFLRNTSLELRARVAETSDPAGPGAVAGMRLSCGAEEPARLVTERGLSIGVSEPWASLDDEGEILARWQRVPIDARMSRSLPVELRLGEPMAGETLCTPAFDPAGCVEALDHVVVLSAAPDATRAFYEEALGIRLALDRSFEARGVRLLFFRLGGVTIEIGSRLGASAEPAAADGFGGLAWRVTDVSAIHARLAGEGFDVSEIRDGHKPGTRVCTVRTPVHGVPTLLIQPAA